jgi:hypothetical protein
MQCEPIEISCPLCGNRASFLEPFEFQSLGFDSETESRPFHRWREWYVIELYPNQIALHPPTGSDQYLRCGGARKGSGYPLMQYGIVQCGSCQISQNKELDWPDDAFWKWEVRGKVLWAWDRKHAEYIREYIASKDRPSRYNPVIRYIPSHFLSAKNRESALKAMKIDLGD